MEIDRRQRLVVQDVDGVGDVPVVYDLGPRDRARPRTAIVALHGHAGDATRFAVRIAPGLRELGADLLFPPGSVLAPEGRPAVAGWSFPGTARIERGAPRAVDLDFARLDALLRWEAARAGRPDRLLLLGFGDGAGLAAAYAVRGPTVLGHVSAVALHSGGPVPGITPRPILDLPAWFRCAVWDPAFADPNGEIHTFDAVQAVATELAFWSPRYSDVVLSKRRAHAWYTPLPELVRWIRGLP